MRGEIAGDPELIEPMDGSAGNRSPPFAQRCGEGGRRGFWMVVEGLRT